MNQLLNQEYDHLFKILLIGNSGVGKSCMLMRYSENEFTSNFYNTIGVDFKIKQIDLEEKTIRLQIVNIQYSIFKYITSGTLLGIQFELKNFYQKISQDRFRTITCSYYRGAHGIIIVYDITDNDSFDNVKTWMQEIDKYAKENVNKLLIGNKSDLESQRKISTKEGEDLAKMYNIPFLECSAKEATNIEKAFTQISKDIMQRLTAQGTLTKEQNQFANVRLGGNSKSYSNQIHQEDTCC